MNGSIRGSIQRAGSPIQAYALALIITAVCVMPAAATDLTLDQALEIAFENSPTMRQAGYSLESSEHNLKAQQAALKSRFTLTLSPIELRKRRELVPGFGYQTTDDRSSAAYLTISQPIKWTDGTLTLQERIDWHEWTDFRYTVGALQPSKLTSSEYTNSMSINYNQPLFTYNRTKMQIEELVLALENAQLNYAIQKLQIEQRVTEQFLSLFHQQRSLQISQEELANAAESYEIIRTKVDAGLSAMEELYQADLTHTNSQANVANKQMSYDNAIDNFKIALGLPLDEEIQVIANVEKNLIDPNLMEAINYGLQHRMELRQRDISLQNAFNSLVRTGARNEFKASVDLSYGLIGNNSDLSGVFDDPIQSQSLSVTMNIPLFDWGEKRHLMDADRAGIESQRLSLSELRKQIEYEIKQSYRHLTNQRLQIEIAEKNVENARRTYDINLERYRNGDLSSKDIAFYQNQLSQQQLNEVVALIGYRTAILDLKIRSLWDYENNRPALESY